MTSWIINYVIDKYLNQFLEVDSEKTDARILKDGQIELGNVKIKRDFLNSLNMPFFEFKETYIGKFIANINFSLLRLDYHFENYPIYVILDEVFILVKQKGLSDWSEEKKIKEMENFKNFTLQQLEDAYVQYLKNLSDGTENEFVKKIIHNLNFSISNIVIRFEDEISDPNNPYSLGIVISNIVSKPTKKDFDVHSTEEVLFSEFNHKIFIIKGLSIFLDVKYHVEESENSYLTLIQEGEQLKNNEKRHYLKDCYDYYCYCTSELNVLSKNDESHLYLIYDLDLTLKLSINHDFKNLIHEPYINSDFTIDSINFNLNILHIKTIIKLNYLINAFYIAKTDIESNFYSKKSSNKEKEQYLEIYIKYFKERYLKNNKEVSWGDLQKELEDFQIHLPFNEIQALRNAAKIKLDFIKQNLDYNEKINQLQPRLFTLYTSQSSLDEIMNLEQERDKLIAKEVEINELMKKEIYKKEIVIDKDPFEVVDKSFIKYNIKIGINKFCFKLCEKDFKELFDIRFKEFELQILQVVKSLQCYLFLGNINVNQYKLKDSVFKKIVESYDDDKNQIPVNFIKNEGSSYINYNAEKKGALSINLEFDPDLNQDKFRIRIRNPKRLYIFANIYSLKYIVLLIREAIGLEINFEEIKKHATKEGYKHLERGYKKFNNILSGEYKYFSIDADILIQGPMIIIPQNIIDYKNKKCFLLSFGELSLKSNLISENDENLDHKIINDDQNLYDRYQMNFYGFEFSTIDTFTNIQRIYNTKKNYFLEKIDLDIIFSFIIEPKNKTRENFKIEMQYKNISVKIRDTQIEFLLYFIKCFNEMNEKLEKDINKLSEDEKAETNKQTKFENTSERFNQFSIEDHREIISENSHKEINLQEVENSDNKIDENSLLKKFFLRINFSVLKISLTFLKSLELEEKELLKSNQLLSDETEYKEYLSFIMNNFNFEIKMKKDLYMELQMKIFHLFLIDNDFKWMLNLDGNIIEHPILNQEFSIIFGTLNDEIQNNKSRSINIKSEIAENMTELLNKFQKIPYFFELKLNQDTPNNNTDLKITLTKIFLTFNLSTFSRITSMIEKMKIYLTKIFNVNKSFIKKSESLKEKFKVIESKRNEYIKSGLTKQFMPKLLNKLKSRKDKNKNFIEIDKPDIINIDQSASFRKNSEKLSTGEMNIYSKRQSIINDNLNRYRKENKKQIIKFCFELRHIEINIPLDAESNKTQAIICNFNSIIKFRNIIESENFYNKYNNELVLQNFMKKNLFLVMKIFNLDLDMYNVANEQVIFNLLNEKILSNTRFLIFVKSFLLPEKRIDLINIEIKIEPITMIIGLRQIFILNDFLEKIKQNLMSKIEGHPKNFQETQNQSPINKKTTYKKINTFDEDFYNKTLNQRKDFLLNLENLSEKDKLFNFKTTKYENALTNKIEKIEKKIKNQIKFNITSYNKLMDLNLNIEKIKLKLIDNIGEYEKPLMMIDLSKIFVKMISNSHPYDIDNMSQAIIEMICEKKPKNLNVYNLYIYLDSYFLVEINYFNERVSDWEPLLEPWAGNFRIEQIDKITRKKLEFRSDLMLNLNFTLDSVEILNEILRYIYQTKTSQPQEININNTLKKNYNYRFDKNLLLKNKPDVFLTIENRSGLNFSFCFLVEESKKYNLIDGFQKSFSKNDLSIIYQNISEDNILRKKDKLAFKFDEISCLIDEIDFTFNHFIVKRIAIQKSDLNQSETSIINSFNMEKNYFIEQEKNQSKEKLFNSQEKREILDLNAKDLNIKIKGQADNSYNAKLENKYLEICVKIKNNGLVKVISIESNINIYNNTNFHTKLFFFNAKANDINKIFIDGKIDISRCAGTLKCNPHSGTHIPIIYLTEQYYVFLSIRLNENNEEEYYNFIISDFNSLYSIGDLYNKKLNNNYFENLEQKNDFIQKITREKCLYLKYVNNKYKYIFALDIQLLKSKNNHFSKILDEEPDEEKNTNKINNFYYQMIINPPIIIENKTPFDLKLNYKNTEESNEMIEKKTNINNDKTYDNYTLYPLEKMIVYDFNLKEKTLKLNFSMIYQNHYNYITKDLNSIDFKEEKTFFKLFHGNNKDYFDINVELKNLATSKFFDNDYLEIESNFSNCRVLILYFDYIVINRLDEDILLRPINKNLEEEEDLLNRTPTCFKIQPKEMNLINNPKNNTKAKIIIEKSSWSDFIDISSHGIITGNSVTFPNPSNPDYLINYEFATIVTYSNNFNYSKILIIEPRHIIVNLTGIDLKFRQILNKNQFINETQVIFNNSHDTVKLNQNQNFNETTKFIQFFIANGVKNEEDTCDELWSQSINIDNLQENNIAIFIPNYFNFKTHSTLDPLSFNIFQYDEKCKFFLIKVLIQSLDNGLIYIILTQPRFPQFLIKNSTKEFVKIRQNQTNQNVTVYPEIVVPYTLKDFDIIKSSCEVEIEIFNKKSILDLNYLEAANEIILDREKDLKSSNYNLKNSNLLNIEDEEKEIQRDQFINSLGEMKIFIYVSTENKNNTRVININSNFEDEKGLIETKNQIILKKVKSKALNLKFTIKGIGLSIIDSFPQEIFYISLYEIKVILRNYISKNGFIINRLANFVVYLKNFQIDYNVEGSFNQIICPKNQYIPFNEKNIKKDEYVDFLKILITKTINNNLINDTENEKISQFEILLQEFNIKLDQKVLNVIFDFVGELFNRFDFYKDQTTNAVEEDFYDIDEEYDILEKGLAIKEIAEKNINKFIHNLDREENKIQYQKSSIKLEEIITEAQEQCNYDTAYLKTKSSISGPTDKRLCTENFRLRKPANLYYLIPEPNLSVDVPNYNQVLKISEESGIYNFGRLTISAIRFNITLRIDLSSLDISSVPPFIVNILGSVGNALTRITDMPLSFNEMRITNIYSNMANISDFILNKYKNQSIIQFYKVFGCSDLIGNPVGLVRKIGTGFVELFDEPRKGFSSGPMYFGTGVVKGVHSLVGNIVGGSLDFLGKITGTLYNTTKNLQEEKSEMIEEYNEPSNLVSGTYQGVKGGVGEIVKGVTGIITNPYKSAKKEGVKGFFKGVGMGLFGAVISPFTAVFKVSNSITVGLKNTANYFTRTKIYTDRFRHPRYINQNESLKLYNKEFAETKSIINNIFKSDDPGEVISIFPKIIYTNDFIYNDIQFQDKYSTVIITDSYLLVVFDVNLKIFDALLKNILKIEVHKIKEEEYNLVIFMRNNVRKFIPSKDFDFLCQIYGVIENLILQ